MSAKDRHFTIFETVAGWCGIAWTAGGVARFQLPVSDMEGAERLLLRRMPYAVRADPPVEVGEAIAAARRYFAGEPTDFSEIRLDFHPQDPFFARVWTLMSAHETEALTRLRQDNLDALSGRVLEVGAGTGTNFAHYPPTVAEVLAVEPEPLLAGHARHAVAGLSLREF